MAWEIERILGWTRIVRGRRIAELNMKSDRHGNIDHVTQ
jgi:hypothetical protein